MKMKRSVVFLKIKFENKFLKDKKSCKVWHRCHYTEEYRDITYVHNICKLKYSAPKKILYFFIMERTMIIILLWKS